MANAGSVGAKRCGNTGGEFCLGNLQPFLHAVAGLGQVGSILEDHEDEAHAEHAVGADRFHIGQPLQRGGNGVGDLVFNDLWRAAHPLGEDDHLMFGKVGDGIHRRGHHPPNPGPRKEEEQKDHQCAVVCAPINNAFNHEKGRVFRMSKIKFLLVKFSHGA